MDECISNNAKCDLDVLEARLKHLNRNKWWLEANDKPKLRTFVKIYDRQTRQTIVKRNLTRSRRSIVTKFKCGVLPILIETGRYKDIPLEQRTCQMCNSGEVEDEQHFLGKCKELWRVRHKYKGIFREKGLEIRNIDIQCMKKMLEPEHVKTTSDMIYELFDKRKEIMYNVIHS